MKAGGLEVDERLSWARRDGDVVSVHLQLRDDTLEPGPASMELSCPTGRFRTQAVVTVAGAANVLVSVPQSELGRSTWSLAIRPATGSSFVPIVARLVAAPASPVALLPGPAPETRMPAPTPRSRRPAHLRMAAHLPAPVRSGLRRARTWGQGLSGRTR